MMDLPSLTLTRREGVLDTLTPLVLYDRLRGLPGPSFLLESLEGGERWARYSFVGQGEVVTFRGYADRVEISLPPAPPRALPVPAGETPLHVMAAALRALGASRGPSQGRLSEGAVGWIGWDAARLFEPRLGRLDPSQELFRFTIPQVLVRFDLLKQRLHLTAAVTPEAASAAGVDASALGQAWLDQAQARILDPHCSTLPPALSLEEVEASRGRLTALPPEVQTTLPRAGFEAAVEQAREYIRAGDIIQVVLSQRLSMPWTPDNRHGGDVLRLYRHLRLVNPSPYLFLLELGDAQLVGSSPEVLVRKTGERIEVRPIAGTRPRGRDEAEDAALAAELLADPKEIAEHIMLVDLGRNDLGRVAQPGSVEVAERLVIERYSHVMHIVSHVRARLRPELGWADVVGSAFPAGTLSGAPKVRAMEIIDALEPAPRGTYGGAVGYVDLDGDMDLCITIRTVHVEGGEVRVQAGAGIVADSEPAMEWQETLNKAGALMKSLLG